MLTIEIEAYFGYFLGDTKIWDTINVELSLGFDPRIEAELTPGQKVLLDQEVRKAVEEEIRKDDVELAFAGIYSIRNGAEEDA